MNADQCRMGRVAAKLGVRELATVARVSASTVARFESGEELQPRTVDAIQQALMEAGIVFIAENGGGPGVRLTPARNCSNELIALTKHEGTVDEFLARAVSKIEDYSARRGIAPSQGAREIRGFFGDDPGSNNTAAEALIRWMDERI